MFVAEMLRIPPTRNPPCGFLNIAQAAFLSPLYSLYYFPIFFVS